MKVGKNIGTQSAIENLISREYTSPVISMYIPTDPVWHNNDKSQIELKNTINKVKEFMEDKTNMSSTEISDLLDPIEDIHNNSDFWKSKNEGMAIFKSKNHFEVIDLL